MGDAVDDTTSVVSESQTDESATQDDDVATIKRRLAGKDQALTRAQQEKARYEAELEQARKKLAEYEQANMTELERLQRALQDAESRAAQAQSEARKHALARKSPDYADFLDSIDGLDLTDAKAAEAFEDFLSKRVAARTGAATEPEPRIDPNRPRRSVPQGKAMSTDDIREAMDKFPVSVLLGAE